MRNDDDAVGEIEKLGELEEPTLVESHHIEKRAIEVGNGCLMSYRG
jgi:hypothetical protein